MPTATINGLSHHYEDQGSGTPLVMLHGAAGSGHYFADVAGAIADDGLRVIVPDMRSMGQSEHVAEIPPSAWVDDVVGLLDHLGIDKAIIHGRSLGARVALRFGIDHADRTLGCILDAPIVANDPAGNAQLNVGFSADTMPEERKAAAKLQHGEDWQAVMENYFNIRNKPDLQSFYNLRESAKTCSVPVLIVRGDDIPDPVHPLDHAIELHKSIPDSRLAIYPNGGSSLTNANPDIFRGLLKEFVGELTGVAAS